MSICAHCGTYVDSLYSVVVCAPCVDVWAASLDERLHPCMANSIESDEWTPATPHRVDCVHCVDRYSSLDHCHQCSCTACPVASARIWHELDRQQARSRARRIRDGVPMQQQELEIE